ncbi:MAG: anthranilate synthase component I, partial [Methanobrevibacter sp.]|nr:anthranilate synthase component I [Methanobrevibacter sp.]
MFSPSIKEVKEIAKNEEYKRIPISYELFSDIATPIEVLRILKGISNHCYMLESIEDAEKWGRYSFLGFDPLLEFTCQDGVVKIKGDADFNEFNDDLVTIETDNPSVIIKDLILKNKSPKLDYLPPFTGGFVGYFAYDYIKYSEPSLNLDAENQDQFKDIDLMLFDKVIAFDNFRQKIIIISNIKTDDLENNYKRACDELKDIANLIKNGKKTEIESLKLKSEFKPVFSREKYCDMVE